MKERHVCADCGRHSPPTETGYTLISKEFGWRLLREVKPDGSVLLEWRCPVCWKAYKQRNAPVLAPPSSRGKQDLSLSGEHSRALLDEEAPPSSRLHTVDATPSDSGCGLRRKRA